MRLSGTSYDRDGTVDSFYVRERFLSFTHWVAIALGSPFVFHQPSSPGGEPAQDLTCPHT